MGKRPEIVDPLAPSLDASSYEGKAASLALLLAAEVAAMSVWFSSSAAIANIKHDAAISASHEALLTTAVQIGFVAGTIISALFCIADRYDPRRLFAFSATTAAIATGALVVLPPTGPYVVALRFLTGICMAGIYPVGMRIAASWARRDLGLIIGLLVGALTLGSASPHLLAATGDIDWRMIYGAASACALLAAMLIGFVRLGPGIRRATVIDISTIAQSWLRPSLRKANIGYLGHMWELYAMWAWLTVFLHQSFAARGFAHADAIASWVTFAAMAAGAIGCWLAGKLADNYGRTSVTIAAMTLSGGCAALTGFLYSAPLVVLLPVILLWGATVVADSAQFSAAIAELAEPNSVGTLLTAQTCFGFLLTLASIQLVPGVQGYLGWPGAFAMLAIGPLAGCVAMWRLRSDPDASRLAGGKR